MNLPLKMPLNTHLKIWYRMTDKGLKELMAKSADDDYNIYDQFNYECDKLWQLITRLCLNAAPPIRVREHTLKSLKEAGTSCKIKVEGRTSKLELWRGDELVGVVISTKPERAKIKFD